MDHSRLPPGVQPLPPGPHKITEAEPNGPGKVTINNPVMSGIQCQVQHPAGHPGGNEPCAEPGLIAGSVMVSAAGPLLLLQLRHNDGTSLSAVLTRQDWLNLAPILNELNQQQALLDAQPVGQG